MRTKKRMHGTVIAPAATQLTLSTAASTVEISITVGEIANVLRDIEPDSAALVERVRNWTKQRILSPRGNVHAGTGKHIRYSRDTAPYEAGLAKRISPRRVRCRKTIRCDCARPAS